MSLVRRQRGQIVTFYSYKGGTGRSMALANAAWILASQGERVLMVDWDLEAPGLHRYFHPFFHDPDLTSSEGIVDLVSRFEEAAVRPPDETTSGATSSHPESSGAWYLPLAKLDRYIVPLTWSFAGDGCLDLLPAGRQGPGYAARVNSFSWSGFYDRLGGGVFIEAIKAEMAGAYDYVLIDSRTGFSDTAGICSVQLPDILIVCFTLNSQSIEGATAVAASVQAQRRNRPTPLRIFPVSMRVELHGDRGRREQARDIARCAFDGFLEHLPRERRDRYWGEVEIPYDAAYAYEELLATFGDTPGVVTSLLASFERMVDHVTDGRVKAMAHLDSEIRARLRHRYLWRKDSRSADSLLAARPELQALFDAVTARQKAWEEGTDLRPLPAPLVLDLNANPELLSALLGEPNFRKFWAAARQAQDKRRQRTILWKRLLAPALLGPFVALMFLLPDSMPLASVGALSAVALGYYLVDKAPAARSFLFEGLGALVLGAGAGGVIEGVEEVFHRHLEYPRVTSFAAGLLLAAVVRLAEARLTRLPRGA